LLVPKPNSPGPHLCRYCHPHRDGAGRVDVDGKPTIRQENTVTEAYLLGGVRTPFARYGGSLSHLRLDDLLGMALRGACERVGIQRDQIEDIVAGCVNPAHEGMGDLARWAALAADFPDTAAGATINRFCGSSLSATAVIAHAIKAGDLGVGIACGAESMSRSGWAYMKGSPWCWRTPTPRDTCASGRRQCTRVGSVRFDRAKPFRTPHSAPSCC
jgi:hypothetical protein